MKLRLRSVLSLIIAIVALWTSVSFGQTFIVQPATLTVSPASLSFGNQASLTTSSTKIVTLKAGTPTAVSFISIITSGDYAQTNTCGTSLAAGATCTVSVTFTPTTIGTGTGILTITDRATGSPQIVPLTGVGVLQTAISPVSLTFGNQAVGTVSAAKSVTLKNNLPTVLSVSSITASGDFSQTSNCGVSVVAGGSCTVSVAFKPSATAIRTGSLTIADSANNSPQTVSLTGTGVVQAAVAPTSLVFGNQAVGTSSTAKLVTFTNNLGAALSIASITLAGDYSQTNTCGTSLVAGGSCTVNIVFRPTTTGSRTGTLTITDGANNSPQTVSITGTGLLQATVAPTSLAFGNQALGTSSTAKTFTLTNNLSSALGISSITASGDYTQTNTCGVSLAAGASCTVSVVFKPTTTGSRTGTVVVSDGANNSPQTVSLTGNGVVPVTVTPTALAFGNQGLSSTSATKTVTVSNKQPTAVSISSITTPGDYAQSNTCGASLAAGASCTVSVTFTPTAVGVRPGTLTLTDNATNSPQTVTLTGNGTALPVIASLTVTSGAVGTSVTVNGTGLGTAATGSLAFNGVLATTTTWTGTAITATVPVGATTGNVVVTVNGGQSNGIKFTVVPTITSLSPTSGTTGTSVSISGTGFGSASTGNTVTFNGVAAIPTTWVIGLISVPVPPGASTGNVVVTVNGVPSNSMVFTVVPNIASLSPTSGPTGTAVTIAGTGFGLTATGNSVTFNGVVATTTAWTSSSISATVPTGASTGNVVVTVNGGPSNGVAFTVVPTITSLSPMAGSEGTAVTITGTGFDSTSSGNTVTFNGVAATPTTWAAGSISVPVPTGAMSGNVVVTVNGLSSNGVAFSVVPNITSLSPASGATGTAVTIIGTGFGPTATGNTVTFNGVAATPTSWVSGSILVPVPTGALTGNVVVTVSGVPSLPNAASLFTVLSGGGLNTSRYQHNATLLSTGKILVAGGVNCTIPGTCTYLNSAELYDPIAGTSSNTGSMATARSAPAVLLANGKVLVAGGYACVAPGICYSQSGAELYDPAAGTFKSVSSLSTSRSGHTMTLLSSGKVLIAGGENCYLTTCSALNTAELYDPKTGIFIPTGNMNSARFNASAVVLNNGLVLVAGGFDGITYPAQAELYDPTKGTFASATPTLNTPRFGASATLLNSGKVLIAGGSTCNLPGCPSAVAELYDPTVNAFALAPGNLNVTRMNHTATLLTNGQVLIAGGYSSCGSSCTSDTSTELFDPATGRFTYSQILATARSGQTGTLLPSGNVALIGGINGGTTISNIESYQPTSLTPPGLVSIMIAPSNPSVLVGLNQQLIAAGLYSDGTLQALPSAVWSSSNPTVATISNSNGSAGIASAFSIGTSTITATVGNVTGSTTMTVPTLLSITLTPVNPSTAVNAIQQLKLTATGVYSDGSSRDITAYVSWTTSNSAVAAVLQSPFVTGVVGPVAVGTTNITASLGGVSASTLVTVTALSGPIPPTVTAVSPTSGPAGTQVTITGSGFGTSQGNGTIWLGSTLATVVSWSDTQVVGTVAANAMSGIAKVQQNGVWSNSLPFGVNTAVITSVTPTNGLAGTQVTISGSGFGIAQGNGQVWLGTAAGIVTSWTDGQIVATVAPGATTGVAQILQNGVLSNSVPFAVNTPQITSITPNSGGPGTMVTINGSGFGTLQGSGIVWIGSTNGQLLTWGDTQITAAVASNAVSGIVRVQQNGNWSNTLTFTVPPAGGGPAVNITPSMISMVVGGTRTVQALDASGNPVTGLTWASSDPTIASLSTDDPPIITAVAPGHATVTGGSGSLDVTVYAGSMPQGTVIWSVPGDGSGVNRILPAVPSATGVADVFAVQNDNTVQAVTSSGAVAWTANVGMDLNGSLRIPDFQGGLVVFNRFQYNAPSIQRYDGLTGQPYPAYFFSDVSSGGLQGNVLVHTDGTIFAVDNSSIVGIDPATGGTKFSVALEHGVSSSSGDHCFEGGPHGVNLPRVESGIIAGDGYAYFPYSYENYSEQTICDSQGQPLFSSHSDTHFRVMRVGTDGSSSEIVIQDWAQDRSNGYSSGSAGGAVLSSMISNADQGVLMSWFGDSGHLTSILGGSASTTTTAGSLTPVLQAQDGSFVGTSDSGMSAFDQYGNLKWSVPNFYPQIATSDGGVIAKSSDGTTYTFDASGNVTGLMAGLPVQSWAGHVYTSPQGTVTRVDSSTPEPATSFWRGSGQLPPGANASGTSTAFRETVETLYVRSFAPWQWFGGAEVIPPCLGYCFLGDYRSFSTSLNVTSRITMIVKFRLPGMAIAGPPIPPYSNESVDVYGRKATGVPTGVVTSENRTLHIRYAGSNPLVIPHILSPDIDTRLDLLGSTDAAKNNQVCYYGNLYGDQFPNAEVFIVDSNSQPTILLTFATSGGPNSGPFFYLPGDGLNNMGDFSSICIAK